MHTWMDGSYSFDLGEKTIEMLQELEARLDELFATHFSTRSDSRGESNAVEDSLY